MRVLKLASFLVLSIALASARPARAQSQAVNQQAGVLQGSVHIGHYDTLTRIMIVKLAFVRYTQPAVLANADTAYVYAAEAFCQSPARPEPAAFYTDRYAVAEIVKSSFVVSEILQIKKVDFCKGMGTDDFARLAIVTKQPLAQVPADYVFNWDAHGTVGGLSTHARTPGAERDATDKPRQDTGPFNLDANLLLSYTDVLKRNGIELGSQEPAAQSAAVAAISQTAAPRKARPDEVRAATYCLSVQTGATTRRFCSSDFSEIAARIDQAALVAKTVRAPQTASRDMARVGIGEVPSRLEIRY